MLTNNGFFKQKEVKQTFKNGSNSQISGNFFQSFPDNVIDFEQQALEQMDDE